MKFKALYFSILVGLFSQSFANEQIEDTAQKQDSAQKEGAIQNEDSSQNESDSNQAETTKDQQEVTEQNSSEQKQSKSEPSVNDSVDRLNENLRFAVNVSALELPFPMSAGLSLIYQKSPKWSVEFNYSRNIFALSTLDVQAKELGQQQLNVKANYYIRENYYATVGIGKRFTSARMNDEYFDYTGYSVDSTQSKFNSDFISVGMGSVFKLDNNIQLNVDWASFNFAFSNDTTKSAYLLADGQENQDIVQGFEQTLQDYVSYSFLRVSLMGQY